MIYKITKIGKVENPFHPYSDFGESKEFHVGDFIKEPTVGERFNLSYINYQNSGISTSPVTKIINENTFETLNSIYRYEPLNE
jgi:hypothetical protein